MRSMSAKRRARWDEVKEWRQDYLQRWGACCWICGHGPDNPWRDKPYDCSIMVLHEISCGPLRQKSLDKRYSLLCLCSYCNVYAVMDRKIWPQPRQLALLWTMNPSAYDLAAFNLLYGRGEKVSQSEVDSWIALGS
jgi:hypothetical protein